MDLLIKNIENAENRGLDNSDKPLLFDPHSITTAQQYQKEWNFVQGCNFESKGRALENISYHLQYIEFLIRLYNKYQINRAIESLLFKDIIINAFSICECVVDDIVLQRGLEDRVNDYYFNHEGKISKFISQMEVLYSQGIINQTLYDAINFIKEERNHIHLSEISHLEHDHYSIEIANCAIKILNLLNKLGAEMSGK